MPKNAAPHTIQAAPRAPFGTSPVDAGTSFGYVADLVGARAVRAICAGLSLPLQRSATRIDFVALWKIWAANVANTGDEGHRLAGMTVPRGNFELLVASMVQGEDLDDGLRRLARGALVLRPDLRIGVANNRRRLHLSVNSATTPTRPREIYIEGFIAYLHCVIRWALARPVMPVAARTSRMLSDADGSVLHALGATVRREGRGTTLVYAESDARARFQRSDFRRWQDAAFAEWQHMVKAPERHVPMAEGPGAQLVQAVRGIVLGGETHQAEVAARLGMSSSTLKRRLAENGLRFGAVLDTARRDMAAVLLLGDKSFEEVAADVGLSDARSLRRACNEWFGQPPSEMRRRHLRLRARDHEV